MVPKGEGAEALKLRPLSVLPTVYRLWAGLRLGDAMKWQESWIHAEAYGFRTGRSAADAAALLQALLELARATGRSMSGAGLDYKKCFDLVPQRIALRLAQECGMALGRSAPPGGFTGSFAGPSRSWGAWGNGGRQQMGSCRGVLCP